MAIVGAEKEQAAKPSLDVLHGLVRNDLAAVNRLIIEKMQSPVALIPQLAGHIIAAGGKQFLSQRGTAGAWRRTGGSTGQPTSFFRSNSAHLPG